MKKKERKLKHYALDILYIVSHCVGPVQISVFKFPTNAGKSVVYLRTYDEFNIHFAFRDRFVFCEISH